VLLHAIIYDSEVRKIKEFIISIPRPQNVVLWMLEMMAASQDDGLR